MQPLAQQLTEVRDIVRAGRRDWRRHHRKDSNHVSRDMLPHLPELDIDLKPRVPEFVEPLTKARDLMRAHMESMEVWYGVKPVKVRDLEQEAWDDAVAWIANRHKPAVAPEPLSLSFSWDWPNRDVSQSPKPLGVGDLEGGTEDGAE